MSKAAKGDASPTPKELLAAALDYAAQGYRVHPLRPGTKVPLVSAWQDEATTDRKTIKRWWAKWPHANVGVATGEASNLWVLDVDLGSHPDEAQEAMAAMVDKHGSLKLTRVVKTPSGGLHYWYAYPKGGGKWTNAGGSAISRAFGVDVVNPKTGKTTKQGGIDVRAEGGQVAAAPSVVTHDNKGKAYKGGPRPYVVTRDAEVVRPPKWLARLTRLAEVEHVALPSTSYDPAGLSDRDRARIASYVETVTRSIADELEELKTDAAAQWDNEVFVRAQRLVDLANAEWSPLTMDAVRGLLLAHSPRDDGFPEARILAKLDSAARRATAVLPLPIAPEPELTTFEFPKDLRPDPDSFFDKRTGLLSERLGMAVADDLGVGIDGRLWVYGGGVWQMRDDEIERRVARLLGDRVRKEHVGIARLVATKALDLPVIAQAPTSRLINLTNGMLDWQTGELEPHSPEYLSTVQLPFAYDPAAKCPTFDRWLAQVVEPDVIPVIWQALGYLTMSGNPRQIAIALFGDGGNGKGTFLRVLNALIGAHNTANVTLRDLSEGKFEVADLFGKLANIAGDIDAKYLSDTSKFKAITGGDRVSAQHKYGHPFSFTPWAVPVFSANEKWKSVDTTKGYFRRWLTLPFPRDVESLGNRLDEEDLLAEVPGIFNKAIRGLLILERDDKFKESASVNELMRAFKIESDVAAIWLANDDRVVSEAGNTTMHSLRADLYRRYTSWSSDNGHSSLASDKFYARLDRLGFKGVRRSGGHSYLGLAITSPLAASFEGVRADDLA